MSETFDKTQIMLSHAFAAYVGSGNFSFLPDHVTDVERSIKSALTQWPALMQDGWDIVWGPACSRLLSISLFDINLMYLAQCRAEPHRFVLAIRGTNPLSLPNWLLEDFFIQEQRPWLFSPGVVRPTISQATFDALHELSSALTNRGRWFEENAELSPLTISEMIGLKLKEVQRTQSQPMELTVTGHSLGGALAPTVGLWLADTQSSWDVARQVTLDVYAFAGPSPGNESFADHFHEMFDGRYHGVVNYNDIVTKGWELNSTRDIPQIYEPKIKASLPTRLFFKGLAHPLRKMKYKRLVPGKQSFSGGVLDHVHSFWLQAMYQHSAAYLEAFNLIPSHLSRNDAIKMTWEDLREAMAFSGPKEAPAVQKACA